jgi:ubiquinone/menaquinone biosynthesis C-methylase UbiE
VHRYPALRERWLNVAGSWDDKVVVDISCGPRNLFAAIAGARRALIGVDVAAGSLELALKVGYTTLLADAHDLPLRSKTADLVVIKGELNHSEDMRRMLAEAAGLVAPRGAQVADHDPQLSADPFKGLGLALWAARVPVYRLLGRGGHSAEDDEQRWALASEMHHRSGDRVTDQLFRSVLEPAGFKAAIHPHNHAVGAEIRRGERGGRLPRSGSPSGCPASIRTRARARSPGCPTRAAGVAPSERTQN